METFGADISRRYLEKIGYPPEALREMVKGIALLQDILAQANKGL